MSVAVAILIAVDANTRDSFATFLIAALVWFAIAGLWLVRFAIAASRSRFHMPITDWVRWLFVPAVMGVVFLLTRTDVLFDARFSASRGALDQMATDVMAGGSTDRGWVGLYDVGRIERTANGFRFVIDDSMLYRLGFAYSPTGEPSLTEDNSSPVWTNAGSEPMGGGWWLWTEEWD
jgi:hypothetical protein